MSYLSLSVGLAASQSLTFILFTHTHTHKTIPHDSDRIQAQCEVAPGQALLEISRIDHTCYWFFLTPSTT